MLALTCGSPGVDVVTAVIDQNPVEHHDSVMSDLRVFRQLYAEETRRILRYKREYEILLYVPHVL